MFIDAIYMLHARSGSKPKFHIFVPLIKPVKYIFRHKLQDIF